jgi:glutaconate CoA-transferase subunit B
MGFAAAAKRMQIIALHPGVTIHQVQANTGFELEVAAQLATTEPPTEEELAVLRHLDPDRLYTA